MKLGEVLKLNKNSNIDIKDTEHYRIAGVQNYGQGIVIRRQVFGSELTMKKYQVIGKNQLMWCKVDTKNGAFGLTQDDHTGSLASSNMALADIDTEKVVPEFLEILFRQKPFADYITNLSSGSTNRKYLTPTQLFGLVELPDLNLDEQKAFIARLRKVENLSIDLRISENKALLSQLKQSILQEAIQGKLTENWREQNPDVEPASELLKRIKAEKAQLIKDKKIRKEKALPPITEEDIPFELPEGWVWCRFVDIAEIARGGSPRPITNYLTNDENGINWIKIGDTKNDDKFINSTREKIKPEGMKKSRFVEPGDFLLTNSMSFGRPYIMRTTGCIHDGWLLIRYSKTFIVQDYLYSMLSSKYVYDSFKETARGGVVQNLNIDKARATIIPIPPLSEQQAIIEKVESLMEKCNALEEEITQSEHHAKILMQAVLKEAFESKKEIVNA